MELNNNNSTSEWKLNFGLDEQTNSKLIKEYFCWHLDKQLYFKYFDFTKYAKSMVLTQHYETYCTYTTSLGRLAGQHKQFVCSSHQCF